MDLHVKGRKVKLHWVFDIDDTIIFDNARSTPNAQVLDLLRMAKGRGDSVHLVTARGMSMKSETIAELGRVNVPYTSLDLATEKQRDNAATISQYKAEMRKKHGPCFATVGDQWTDLVVINVDSDLDVLDQQNQVKIFPWQVAKLDDGS
jgi:hypothetical protein